MNSTERFLLLCAAPTLERNYLATDSAIRSLGAATSASTCTIITSFDNCALAIPPTQFSRDPTLDAEIRIVPRLGERRIVQKKNRKHRTHNCNSLHHRFSFQSDRMRNGFTSNSSYRYLWQPIDLRRTPILFERSLLQPAVPFREQISIQKPSELNRLCLSSNYKDARGTSLGEV